MNNEMNQGGYDLLSLVALYNETEDERYFSQLWEEVKAFSFTISKKYYEISIEDKESVSKECLWNCCKTLKPGTNLLTMYGTVLNHRFYDMWAKKMQRDNYKMNANAMSLDQMYEDVRFEPRSPEREFSLEMFIYECQLSELEAVLCTLLYQGYKRADIMKVMNLTNSGQYNRLINKLREKVNKNYSKEGLCI